MARSFVRTSSQYLEVDSPPVTAAPFTVAAWVWTDEGSNDKVVAFIGDKDSASQYWYLAVDASERVLWEANATTAARARSGVVFGLSQWNHLVGVERSATDREVYYNGASQATNATSKSPSGADRVSIGRSGTSSPGIYWDDHMAEVAVWNVALNTDEITALSKGVSPLLIRPTSLVFYLPLVRDADKDIKGGLSLTAFNTPTVADHPRVFNPAGLRVGQVVAGGTAYNQSADGTLTSAGVVSRNMAKVFAGTLTSAGTIVRSVAKAFAGTLSSAGIVSRAVNKNVAGTLTPSGALASVRTFLVSVAGTLTSSGVLVRQTNKPISGGVTPSGSLIRVISKLFTGTLTSAGILSRQAQKFLMGTLTSAGGVVRSAEKSTGGALSSQGSVSRVVSKLMAGSLGVTGAVNKLTSKIFAGVLGLAGDLVSLFSGGGSVSFGTVTIAFASVNGLSVSFASVNGVSVSFVTVGDVAGGLA